MRCLSKNYFKLILGGILCLSLLAGCGGGGGGGGSSSSAESSSESSTSSVIGTSGGSVTLNDVTVNIPANLLSQDAKVTLTEVLPSTLQIDNSFVLGTPVQITIEPITTSSVVSKELSVKAISWGDVTQSITFYWNNIDEAKAAIFGSTCLATEIVTAIKSEFKFLNMPCKLSNSTAMVTMALFLQYGNTSLQKFFGTYALLSPAQLRELNIPPSLKSFALTDENQLGESREFDNSPLNGRTAVILIHGINRDENLGWACKLNNSDKERFWCYEYKRDVWNAFYEEAAKKAGFYNKFKVYEYVYPSFKSSSFDNGPSLSSIIQNDPELANSKIFLVAHSYGGLVARRAMNANNGVLGNQTTNLFTLATPHHGSIGASLLNFNQKTNNDAIANSWLSDKKTLITLAVGKILYGLAVGTEGYTDLLWDNFDGGIPQHWTDNVNVFTSISGLKTFNETGDKFKGKIITYSGGNVGVLDPTVVNDILNSSDPFDALGKIPDTISLNEVILWFTAETIKRFGEYNDDSNQPNYPDSDGMVPRSSANFEGGGVTNDLVLDDVNHEQIFDDLRVINTIQNKMWTTYPIDVSGIWYGSWQHTSMVGDIPVIDRWGTILTTLNQTGTSITGSIAIKDNSYSCFTSLSGSISGSINGNIMNGSTVQGSVRTDYIGTVSGNKINGNYSISGGTCNGESGTWTIDKITELAILPCCAILIEDGRTYTSGVGGGTPPYNISSSDPQNVYNLTPGNGTWSVTTNGGTFTVNIGETPGVNTDLTVSLSVTDAKGIQSTKPVTLLIRDGTD